MFLQLFFMCVAGFGSSDRSFSRTVKTKIRRLHYVGLHSDWCLPFCGLRGVKMKELLITFIFLHALMVWTDNLLDLKEHLKEILVLKSQSGLQCNGSLPKYLCSLSLFNFDLLILLPHIA